MLTLDTGPELTPPVEPTPAPPAHTGGHERAGTQSRPLSWAVLFSVLAHALLLSLTFSGDEFGLTGLDFAWRERRVDAADVRLALAPVQRAASAPAAPFGASVNDAAPPPSLAQPLPAASVLTVTLPDAPALELSAEMPVTAAQAAAPLTSSAKPVPAPLPAPLTDTAPTAPAPEPARVRTEALAGAAPAPPPEPALIAIDRHQEAALLVPVAPAVLTPVISAAPSAQPNAAPSASSPQAVAQPAPEASDVTKERERAAELAKAESSQREAQRQAAQLEATRAETARMDAARLETQRHEAAQQAAARQEAAQLEAARQEAQRIETARLEALRQDAARQATARLEAARIEAARQEAQRVEATRQETARQEAARKDAEKLEAARQASERQEAARQDAAQQAAAQQEAARIGAAQDATKEAAKEAAARREAALRAIGQQLNEEAARREAASVAANQPPRPGAPPFNTRRGRLFGRTDANAELILYAEAWARKIQLNMTYDMVRDAAKQRHAAPLVTVAIRSDGSVESVIFVLSSGVAEMDEAVRRVVQSQAPYQAFSPALAREYDVIEIRRTWHVDMAIRLN